MKTDNSLSDILSLISNNHEIFTGDTVIAEYLRWLASVSNEHKENSRYELYKSIIAEEADYTGKRPFLTVVMRTQGRRISAFKEALLCLYSQTDQDFEIVIVGHKVDKANESVIKRIIDEQEENLRAKIRYYSVDFGNRTAPLNFGFAHARGFYISSYDDDDIIMGDYVNAIHCAADKHNGRLIHVYFVSQKCSMHGVEDTSVPCAESAPDAMWCRPFSLPLELDHNLCQFSSVAFPASLFTRLNIWFDEDLDTAEDWDYIVRTAMIVGVHDVKRILEIYRQWINAENSFTVHSQEIWESNGTTIKEKFNRCPVLLPPGTARLISDFYTAPVRFANEHVKAEASGRGRLYCFKEKIKRFLPHDSFLYRFCRKIYKTIKLKSKHSI